MQGSRANKEARRGNIGDGIVPRKKYAAGGSLMYGSDPAQRTQMNPEVVHQQQNSPNRMMQNSFRAPDDDVLRPNRYYAKGGDVNSKRKKGK